MKCKKAASLECDRYLLKQEEEVKILGKKEEKNLSNVIGLWSKKFSIGNVIAMKIGWHYEDKFA